MTQKVDNFKVSSLKTLVVGFDIRHGVEQLGGRRYRSVGTFVGDGDWFVPIGSAGGADRRIRRPGRRGLRRRFTYRPPRPRVQQSDTAQYRHAGLSRFAVAIVIVHCPDEARDGGDDVLLHSWLAVPASGPAVVVDNN